MKFIKYLSLLPVIGLLFFTQANLSSCQKQIITDTVVIKDTVVVRDTVKITDTVSCYNLKDSLVAYYNFNGGNLNDSSGYNNQIVFNNALKTADRFGRANNAYLFDGKTNFMKVLNSASLNPQRISMVAMVKFHGFYRGPCHGNQIFKKGFQDQENGIYGLRASVANTPCNGPVDTTKEQITGYYGNNQSSSVGIGYGTDFIKPNVWMTVVFTYDGVQAKMYVDGKLKESLTRTVPFTPNTFDLFIGRAERPDFPYWFNGVIDEIRIYKKALCDGEVKELSNLKN